MQTFLLGRFGALDDKVNDVAAKVANVDGRIDGVEGKIDNIAQMVAGMASKSQVNVTGTDNSQSVHAGGDAIVGRDNASASKSTNNFSIEKIVEKAKENPLATAGIGGGLWWFWPKIQAVIEAISK